MRSLTGSYRFVTSKLRTQKSTFQVNKRISRILMEKKRQMHWRLRRKQYADQHKPMFTGGKIKFSISEKVRAIGYGGIGAMHILVRKLKLDRSPSVPDPDGRMKVGIPDPGLQRSSGNLLCYVRSHPGAGKHLILCAGKVAGPTTFGANQSAAGQERDGRQP